MANSTWARIQRPPPRAAVAPARPPRRPLNWPLWLGLAMVMIAILVAWRGPELAPRDPMQRNTAVRVGNEFLSNPIPPFTAPGLPLGTDELGRDIWSRLLIGTRPTLTLVGVAALLRLALGLLIGLGAGWGTRWGGRLLDGLIAAALAIPLLIVALLVVAPLADLWGARAFLLGLTLTGWGESARQVREQVRLLRGSTFVEASRALGGTGRQVIANHVIHHLVPLLAVLFAFEVSSTLLTVAGLGFIGYFVGGEVWSPISDFVAARYSGQPELGEMLNLDLGTIFFGPWRVVAAGGTVAFIVLGFNLLGDGLRLQAQRERQRASLLSRATHRLDDWMVERFNLSAGRVLWTGALLALLLFVGVPRLADWWEEYRNNPAEAQGGTAAFDGGTLALAEGTFPPAALTQPAFARWGSAYGGPHGTRSISGEGPTALDTQWTIRLPGAPSGPPAIDEMGNLYVALSSRRLVAYGPEGDSRWARELFVEPVGGPALGPGGLIYVADIAGGFSTFTTAGEQTGFYQPTSGRPGATSGPIVAEDETLFLTQGNQVVAFRRGMPLWGDPELLPRARNESRRPLALSAEGELLFYGEMVIRASDGSRVEDPVLETVDPEQLFVGGDGYNYMRAADAIVRWVWDGERIQPLALMRWDRAGLGGLVPNDSGATVEGDAWLTSRVEAFDDRFIWAGRSPEETRSAIFPAVRNSLVLIGSDGSGTAYLCGSPQFERRACYFVEPGSESFRPFDQPFQSILGGGLVRGRAYIVGTDFEGGGQLAALGTVPGH